MLSKGNSKTKIRIRNNLKIFQKKLYDKCKQDLVEIYDNIAEEICIRSRCYWYKKCGIL